MIAEDLAKGVVLDVAADKALAVALKSSDEESRLMTEEEPRLGWVSGDDKDDSGDDPDEDEPGDGHDDEVNRTQDTEVRPCS